MREHDHESFSINFNLRRAFFPVELLENGITKIFPNGTLLIRSITEEQEGYYVCAANNGIGAGLDHIVHVKVYGKC